MLILSAYGVSVECDRAEKGIDFIKVYSEGEIIRWDSEISDFSGYTLTDENGNPAEFERNVRFMQ